MRFCFRILFALSFYTITVKGQSPYAVSSIPADLKSRAGAVIRNLETNLEIKDPQNVVYRVKKSITVFNKSADAQANIQVWYDKTRTIKSIKALVFDESGKPIGKIQEKDFRDVSVADDASLFEYSRMKVFRPAITTYPFTIEYEYEIKMKQSMNLPNWTPNASPGVSLENAKLTVFCRPDLTLRYKEINFQVKRLPKTPKKAKYMYGRLKILRFSEMSHTAPIRSVTYLPSNWG